MIKEFLSIILFVLFFNEIHSNHLTFENFVSALNLQNNQFSTGLIQFQKKKIEIPTTCNLFLKDRSEYANYLQLNCQKFHLDRFLYFGNIDRSNRIISFEFNKTEVVGNRQFFIIEKIRYSKNKYSNIENNKNLTVFFKSMKNQKIVELNKIKNEYIHFDKYCPLEFISIDTDFHWEKFNIVNFRISCFEQESDYTLSIKTPTKEIFPPWITNLQSGQLIHARVKFDTITTKEINWKDIESIP